MLLTRRADGLRAALPARRWCPDSEDPPVSGSASIAGWCCHGVEDVGVDLLLPRREVLPRCDVGGLRVGDVPIDLGVPAGGYELALLLTFEVQRGVLAAAYQGLDEGLGR